MSDFVHIHQLKADIRTGVNKRYGGVLLGQGDDSADVFEVELIDSTLPAGYDTTGSDATGCNGYFIRPDGRTETIAGTVTGGVGTVALTPACYAYPGAFSLAVKFTSSAAEATAVIIEGRILTTYTDEVADSSNVWHLDAIQAAIDGKMDEPASEGSSGQALITDGAGGRSWGSVSAASATAIKIGNDTYTVRTGSTGASGYLTLVTE